MLRKLVLTLTILAVPSWAESMVATLLPPPVEALRAAPVTEKITAMVAVPVLKQPVQKGETITADNITMQEIPAKQAYASTVASAEDLAGQQAVRPLGAAQPINRLHVRVAPTVSRNQLVTLIFRKGGIQLTGQAQALEDGQTGQSIRIMNTATRTTLTGTVGQNGTVQIN